MNREVEYIAFNAAGDIRGMITKKSNVTLKIELAVSFHCILLYED